jgi:hypothetical protein
VASGDASSSASTAHRRRSRGQRLKTGSGSARAPWCRASADAGEGRVSGAQSRSAPPDTQTTDPTARGESEVTLGARWAFHGQRDIIRDAKWCQPEGFQAPGGAGGIAIVAGRGQMRRIAPLLSSGGSGFESRRRLCFDLHRCVLRMVHRSSPTTRLIDEYDRRDRPRKRCWMCLGHSVPPLTGRLPASVTRSRRVALSQGRQRPGRTGP